MTSLGGGGPIANEGAATTPGGGGGTGTVTSADAADGSITRTGVPTIAPRFAVTLATVPPLAIGAQTLGTSLKSAREDHAHAHGDQLGGTLHSVADGANAGFMSAAGFTKLAGIAALAAALGGIAGANVTLAAGSAGIAVTAAASDHTHALDQSIAPAWTGVHTWTNAAVPVTATITDTAAATQIEAARFQHKSTIAGTVGAASYVSFWAPNSTGSGAMGEAGRLYGILKTVTAGSESGVLVLTTNTTGALTSTGNCSWTQAGVFATTGSFSIGTLSALGVTTINSSWAHVGLMVNYQNNNAGFGGFLLTGTVNTSGARSFFIDNPSANTSITTATERITRAWGCTSASGVPSLTSIVQTWANGTVALQRENVWVAPTYLQASGTQVMTVAVHHDFGSIPQITGTTNSITGARIARFGGSVAQGVTAATTTYVGVELVPHTITYTGSTQVTSTVGASMLRLDILTLTDASAVTIDQVATLDIVGAPAAAGSVTLTKSLALLVRAGGSQLATVGFNSTAPIAKPTVTGAKGSNAALGSLMTALANYGLVTDSTSA